MKICELNRHFFGFRRGFSDGDGRGNKLNSAALRHRNVKEPVVGSSNLRALVPVEAAGIPKSSFFGEASSGQVWEGFMCWIWAASVPTSLGDRLGGGEQPDEQNRNACEYSTVFHEIAPVVLVLEIWL